MIVGKITGGLGNQMFQYAYYRGIASSLNVNLKLDVSVYNKTSIHEGFLLENAFSIRSDYASRNDLDLFFLPFSKKLQYITYRYFPKLANNKSILIEKNIGYKKYNIKDNSYLDGYWQSYKYFSENRFDPFEIFKFKNQNIKNIQFENYIKENKIASIHIRRGDYLSKNIYNNLDEKYYNLAINYLRRKYGIYKFLIFTDDKNWFYLNRYKLNCENFLIFEGKTNSIYDMYLMTLCKYNINANSTYSWWGAFLNKNNYKEVIAPKKWYSNKFRKENSINMNDLYPEDWIVI